MAPEILQNKEYNYKCDLWSIGIIIYRLFFGKSPFTGETESALISNIETFNKKALKKTGNKDLDDLINHLLEIVVDKRLSWDNYFNHSFFKKKDNKEIEEISGDKKNIKKFPNVKIEYKNKIKLIYEAEKEDIFQIFGKNFVNNNYNNIELIINGIKSELSEIYEFNKGPNEIQIIIKNKLQNLEYMFFKCDSLKNIDELKYLDTTEVNNFSKMFKGCSLLSDIKALEYWDVTKGKDFSGMFCSCSSLSNLNGLENWDVSNGNDFSEMFKECNILIDIKALENWNFLNSYNFDSMF